MQEGGVGSIPLYSPGGGGRAGPHYMGEKNQQNWASRGGGLPPHAPPTMGNSADFGESDRRWRGCIQNQRVSSSNPNEDPNDSIATKWVTEWLRQGVKGSRTRVKSQGINKDDWCCLLVS